MWLLTAPVCRGLTMSCTEVAIGSDRLLTDWILHRPASTMLCSCDIIKWKMLRHVFAARRLVLHKWTATRPSRQLPHTESRTQLPCREPIVQASPTSKTTGFPRSSWEVEVERSDDTSSNLWNASGAFRKGKLASGTCRLTFIAVRVEWFRKRLSFGGHYTTKNQRNASRLHFSNMMLFRFIPSCNCSLKCTTHSAAGPPTVPLVQPQTCCSQAQFVENFHR